MLQRCVRRRAKASHAALKEAATALEVRLAAQDAAATVSLLPLDGETENARVCRMIMQACNQRVCCNDRWVAHRRWEEMYMLAVGCWRCTLLPPPNPHSS